MSVMEEVKVVRVDAREGKPVKDVIYGYRYPVTFTLVDGRTVEGSETARLLRDAKAKVAALPEINPVGVKAIFMDGRFSGVSRSYGLSFAGRGMALVPEEFD